MLKFTIFVYMSNGNYDKANHCQAIWCMPVNCTKLTVILSCFFLGKQKLLYWSKVQIFFPYIRIHNSCEMSFQQKLHSYYLVLRANIIIENIVYVFDSYFFFLSRWVFGLFHNLSIWLSINCDRFGKRHFKYLQMTRYFSVKIFFLILR